MCHTSWNQHNMSSYGIWGGWQQLEELWLEVPRNVMCEERNEESIDYATMKEGSQHIPRSERFDYETSLKDMYNLMEVCKRWRSLTIYIYIDKRCVNM